MPVPVFQAPVGAPTTSAGATSRTTALPTGFAAGNLLLWATATKNNANHVYPAPWTKFGQINSGAGWTSSLAWKIAAITDGAGTVTWAGSAACISQIWRYSGTDPINPWGAAGGASIGTGTAHTSVGFTSTRANSLALLIDMTAVNTALGAIVGWTTNVSDGTGGATAVRLDALTKPMPTINTASGTVFPTGGNAAWIEYQLEILSPLVPGAGMAFSNMPMLGM